MGCLSTCHSSSEDSHFDRPSSESSDASEIAREHYAEIAIFSQRLFMLVKLARLVSLDGLKLVKIGYSSMD